MYNPTTALQLDTIIHKRVANLFVSAIFWGPSSCRYSTKRTTRIASYDIIICDNGVKIHILKWLENLKSIERTVYRDSYYLKLLTNKQTNIYFRNSSPFPEVCPCVCYGCFYYVSPRMAVMHSTQKHEIHITVTVIICPCILWPFLEVFKGNILYHLEGSGNFYVIYHTICDIFHCNLKLIKI
jgi:hypothetical protein